MMSMSDGWFDGVEAGDHPVQDLPANKYYKILSKEYLQHKVERCLVSDSIRSRLPIMIKVSILGVLYKGLRIVLSH